MARFIGKMKGKAGEASRLGSNKSGFLGQVQGWDAGIEVEAVAGGEDAEHFYVFQTGGSNNPARKLIGVLVCIKGERKWIPD